MNDNQFSEQLFQATETIINQKLANFPTGGTVLSGRIIEHISDYIYKVQVGDITIECLAEIEKTYEPNDSVQVYVPNNDLSSTDKLILGKFSHSVGRSKFEHLNALQHMTQNITFNLDSQLKLPIKIGQATYTSGDIFLPAGTLPKALNRLCLQLNLSTSGLEQLTEGEYGVRLELFSNGIPIKAPDLVFSCTEDIFCTFPYTITPNITMTKVFELTNIPIHLVNQIKLTLYSMNNFTANGTITLEKATIILGEDISHYANKPISLYLDYSATENYNQEDVYLPTIHALLVDQNSMLAQPKLLSNQTIRWYEYVLGHPGDSYGGLNWRYIDTEDNNLLLDKFVFDSYAITTDIKALWCENQGNGILHILGESDPITFKNVFNYQKQTANNANIVIVGKSQLPVYNANNNLQYTESKNYIYKLNILSDIDVTSIEWSTSIDGLIAGFIDPNTQTIVQSQLYNTGELPYEITIVPQQVYDASYADGAFNIITCKINNQYEASFKIDFDLLTSQGTNYIFKIEPIDTPYLSNAENATQTLAARLTMSDGTVVPIVNDRLSWSWYQYDTYWQDDEEYEYINIIDDVVEHTATLTLTRGFDTVFAPAETAEQLVVSNADNDSEVTLIPIDPSEITEENDNTASAQTVITKSAKKCNTHILQAKYLIDAVYKTEKQEEITRTIELVALYPVKIIGPNVVANELVVNGIFELNWNNEGILTTYAPDDYENDNGIIPIEEYALSTHPSALWSAQSEKQLGYYQVRSFTNDNSIAYYLQLPQGYSYISEKIAITAVDDKGKLLYQQPLMLTLNNFSIDMTNKWAGGVVTIDEEAATIMATAMGAGHKNVDNSFTGVLMGDVQLNQQSDIDSGLFGFNEGKMVFKLNKDAEFFVGSDKDNYISFKDNFFDLKTQTLKLNALADNFIIDSTGTSPAKFEQQTITKEIIDGVEQEVVTTQTTEVDNAVIAAHNNFIVTADGKVYAKNVQGFEMASNAVAAFSGSTRVINPDGEIGFTLGDIPSQIRVEVKNQFDNLDISAPELKALEAVQDNMVTNLAQPEEKPQYEINIKAGKVGSWSLTNDYLYAETGEGDNKTITALMGANVKPKEPNDLTDLDGNKPESWYLWFKGKNSDSAFGVDTAGTLYAKNGIFKGQIEAETGKIGGWNIGIADDLHNDGVSALYNTNKNGQILALMTGSSFENPVPGDLHSAGRWHLWFGKENEEGNIDGNFGVTDEGILFATGAVITGELHATKGSIGGFYIGELGDWTTEQIQGEAIFCINAQEQITGFFSGNGVSIDDNSKAGFEDVLQAEIWKLWFADENGKGRFGITSEGNLYARDAYFSGHVEATSGTFGSFLTLQDGLLKSVTGIENSHWWNQHFVLGEVSNVTDTFQDSFLSLIWSSNQHLCWGVSSAGEMVVTDRIRLQSSWQSSANQNYDGTFIDIKLEPQNLSEEHPFTLKLYAQDHSEAPILLYNSSTNMWTFKGEIVCDTVHELKGK